MAIYSQGVELFDDLLEDLKKARKSIHMEYFIWKSDELGQKFREILTQKAAEGVEVRLLFDGRRLLQNDEPEI